MHDDLADPQAGAALQLLPEGDQALVPHLSGGRRQVDQVDVVAHHVGDPQAASFTLKSCASWSETAFPFHWLAFWVKSWITLHPAATPRSGALKMPTSDRHVCA